MTRRVWMVACLTGAVALGGCGPSGPKFQAVTVRLTVDGGNVADLTGSTLDVAVPNNPLLRSSGTITPDGTVELETLHAGKIRRGVQEGNYQVRIILADDDREQRRKAAKTVAPRFLKFESSGLSLTVPGDGTVPLTVAAK
ncbi:hypothetical protein [Limnoglobus roseus]|uniref:Carboxypeptidase regulatory-like domain-containing protein n=1 Tax=Limnoglobus roseus TaxID=2598579 RepID=A0A5C1AEF7_9BACT|nr:hypothetical protein [Limnoglobus roseus]QEL17110.1 hypothetical protein PX52LOC_04090 [Limnoglobus roseus]